MQTIICMNVRSLMGYRPFPVVGHSQILLHPPFRKKTPSAMHRNIGRHWCCCKMASACNILPGLWQTSVSASLHRANLKACLIAIGSRAISRCADQKGISHVGSTPCNYMYTLAIRHGSMIVNVCLQTCDVICIFMHDSYLQQVHCYYLAVSRTACA